MKSSILLLIFHILINNNFCAASESEISVHLFKSFPYVYQHNEHSELKGIEFELIKLIENQLNRKLKIKLFQTYKNRHFNPKR